MLKDSAEYSVAIGFLFFGIVRLLASSSLSQFPFKLVKGAVEDNLKFVG